MPIFQSKKVVEAHRITRASDPFKDLSVDLDLEGQPRFRTMPGFANRCNDIWLEQTNSSELGYLVIYSDNYHSWCPTDIFERENQPVTYPSPGENSAKVYAIEDSLVEVDSFIPVPEGDIFDDRKSWEESIPEVEDYVRSQSYASSGSRFLVITKFGKSTIVEV